MARVAANGIEIEYEVTGAGPPLLLVMGLGGQLTDWPQHFVERLAVTNTVILFDNRDAGLSTRVEAPVPGRLTFVRSLWPGAVDAPYGLSDLAADAAGLLEALDIDGADVVGMSMGGMIAQLVAIEHPHLVRSLCSIMSNTGARSSGQPSPRLWRHLLQRIDPPRDEAVDRAVDFFERIGGPDWDRDEQRARTAVSIARSYRPDGVLRQSLAIATSGDRTERLGAVRVPTLVVHGLDDPLVRPSGGVATAAAVPASRLLMFPGMGHDLPARRHGEIVAAIGDNIARGAVSVA